MRFTCLDDKEPAVVSIEQDENEVNILVNGIVVAWFSESGDLMLNWTTEASQRETGLNYTNGYVRLYP